MTSIDLSNFAKAGDPSSVHVPAPGITGPSMSVAGVQVTNLGGLRRWRVALADALNAEAPIVFGGDSRVYGQFADGVNAFAPSNGRADAPWSMPGQLRSLFAQQYGDPGEGFQFVNGVYDSAAVVAGAGFAYVNPGQSAGILRQNWRLPQTSATITGIAVPANVTRAQVILSSNPTETNGLYQINGGSQVSLGFGTNDNVPSLKTVAVTSGQVLNTIFNAGGNVTYLGFSLRTALTGCVPVHRVGIPGNTIWDWQGGIYNGQIGTYDGTNFYTAAQQTMMIRAMYKWNATPGLLIVHSGGNEQTNQIATAGIGCGCTPALFKLGVQNVVNQAVADGWCVLLLGPNPTGATETPAPAQPGTSYTAQLQSIAATTDHCAFIDMAELWGGPGAQQVLNAYNSGLRDQFTAHPSRKGYGDLARNLFRVLSSSVPVGN